MSSYTNRGRCVGVRIHQRGDMRIFLWVLTLTFRSGLYLTTSGIWESWWCICRCCDEHLDDPRERWEGRRGEVEGAEPEEERHDMSMNITIYILNSNNATYVEPKFPCGRGASSHPPQVFPKKGTPNRGLSVSEWGENATPRQVEAKCGRFSHSTKKNTKYTKEGGWGVFPVRGGCPTLYKLRLQFQSPNQYVRGGRGKLILNWSGGHLNRLQSDFRESCPLWEGGNF